MRVGLLPLIAAVGLLVGMGACGPGWAAPQITPRTISVGNVSVAGLTVDVELDVYNPNTEVIPVRSVQFDLRVGNSMAMPGHGLVSEGLAPLQTTPVSVTVHVSGPAAISVASQILGGRRDYSIDGDVIVEYRGTRRVDFQQRGQL